MSVSMQWIIKGDDVKVHLNTTCDDPIVHVDWREGLERHSFVVSGDPAAVVAMLDEIREPFAAELRATEGDYDAAEARYDARFASEMERDEVARRIDIAKRAHGDSAPVVSVVPNRFQP